MTYQTKTQKQRRARLTRNTLLAGAALSIGVLGYSGNGINQNAVQAETTKAEAIYQPSTDIRYETAQIQGQDIFYRDAGPKDAPVILLLHGFPTSSFMFRDLIPELAGEYRVIAPDYPGFGHSSAPDVKDFDYSFDNFYEIVEDLTEKLELDNYALYVMDYGAPVGFRLAHANPDKVTGLIIQNGNAYDEGLREFWDPIREFWADWNPETEKPMRDLLTLEATKWQYSHGHRDTKYISPDIARLDQFFMDRPGNKEIQLQMFQSYKTNPPLYADWQEYFRTHQPPALIVWGKGDHIFPAEGAYPYLRDLKDVDFNIVDSGHFILEDHLDFVADKIKTFMKTKANKA